MLKKRKLLLILIPISIVSSVTILVLQRDRQPGDAELELYFRAAAAFENGDFTSCINLTQALADGCPAFYQAGMLLGKAQFFSDQVSKAEMTFEELIDNKENYYEAEIWNLRCKIQAGNIEKARIFGEELLSRSPEDPRILGLLGRISTLEHDYQQALEFYKRAVLFEEVLAINRIDTAKIYFSIQNPEAAVLELKKAVDLAADSSPLRFAVNELINKFGENE